MTKPALALPSSHGKPAPRTGKGKSNMIIHSALLIPAMRIRDPEHIEEKDKTKAPSHGIAQWNHGGLTTERTATCVRYAILGYSERAARVSISVLTPRRGPDRDRASWSRSRYLV